MKNSEIATAFKNSVEATNSNDTFYVEKINGVIIAFSYGRHFPIAIKFTDGVFFTSSSYSNTTSRHKSLILSTLSEVLTNDDLKTASEMCSIVNKIKYDDVRSKAELVLQKI